MCFHVLVVFGIIIFIYNLDFGHWFCNTEIPLTLTDSIHCYFPKQRWPLLLFLVSLLLYYVIIYVIDGQLTRSCRIIIGAWKVRQFVVFSILWSLWSVIVFFQYNLRSKIAFLWILSNLYVDFILLFDRTENGCFMCSDVNKLVNFIGIYLY